MLSKTLTTSKNFWNIFLRTRSPFVGFWIIFFNRMNICINSRSTTFHIQFTTRNQMTTKREEETTKEKKDRCPLTGKIIKFQHELRIRVTGTKQKMFSYYCILFNIPKASIFIIDYIELLLHIITLFYLFSTLSFYFFFLLRLNKK